MNVTPKKGFSTGQQGILVFTDLDGTLLDDKYRWDAAEPALETLQYLKIPLILSSSKTLDEIVELATALAPDSPLIAENGATIAIPATKQFSNLAADGELAGSYQVEFNGLKRAQILEIAHKLREAEGYRFEGFHDWTVERIREETGLSQQQAARAANRLATEPIRWMDSEKNWNDFAAALKEAGVKTIKGGRFIHLMGGIDKAVGLRRVRQLYQDLGLCAAWQVIALGDSPNDLDMLSAADIAVVIPNPRHPTGLNPTAPRVFRASKAGPQGWNEALQNLFTEIQE